MKASKEIDPEAVYICTKKCGLAHPGDIVRITGVDTTINWIEYGGLCDIQFIRPYHTHWRMMWNEVKNSFRKFA